VLDILDATGRKIVNGKISSGIRVVEDTNSIVFRHASPVHRGHIWITCNDHFGDFGDLLATPASRIAFTALSELKYDRKLRSENRRAASFRDRSLS